jgi:uncharacterized protein YhhL (DUF1145 family)
VAEETKDPEEKEEIDFERLQEFFFDLCLSWCQNLDIEMCLFFIHGIFLNISSGSHLNVSELKDLDEIQVLPVGFFNALLQFRKKCEKETEEG